jgi:hypothetical protein
MGDSFSALISDSSSGFACTAVTAPAKVPKKKKHLTMLLIFLFDLSMMRIIVVFQHASITQIGQALFYIFFFQIFFWVQLGYIIAKK